MSLSAQIVNCLAETAAGIANVLAVQITILGVVYE
jgi:hypothetical protein